MGAEVFDIVRKVDQLSWPSGADFVLGAGQAVAPQVVLEQRNWSLYSLDLTTDLAWFVELPEGFDLSASAFAFIDQHAQARRVLQMSLSDLQEVAATAASPRHVIFVFNIGRCGSTLISHVLNTSPEVWGLSEPVAFVRLILQNYDSEHRLEASRGNLVNMIRACTLLQFRPPMGSSRNVFALKFHSQTLFQADLYHEAFPDASFVFLYRDAIGWTKSWYQMARKYGFAAELTGAKKSSIWNTVTAADDLALLAPYVDLDAPGLPLEDGLVIGWARNLEEYERQLAAGVPFLAMRYNDLNRDREMSLVRLFRHCGLPPDDAVAGLAAFDRDSQAGTLVSHDVAAEEMTDAQVDRLRGVLARHPRHGDPDQRLADIHSPAPAS